MSVVDVAIIVGAVAAAVAISYEMLRRKDAAAVPIVAPVALIIAHPDDESMFFVPTLVNICGNMSIHLVCMSNGDSAGLGRIRAKELQAAAQVLGFDHEPVVITDERLPDRMDQRWASSAIRHHVDDYVRDHDIKSIITFDDYGVSGHLNHISISKALCNQPPDGVALYVLESLPIWRKYLGPLNLLFEASRVHPFDVVFVTRNPLVSYRAMKQHWSQLVWFRHLFVVFSSYTFFNRLRRIKS